MSLEPNIVPAPHPAAKRGVKTPEGKAISRLNARKHGIFATALTAEDADELHTIQDRLEDELRPVGILEEILVEKIALTYLQLQRCARAEAQYHLDVWGPDDPDPASAEHPPQEGRAVLCRRANMEKMINLFMRYDTCLTNRFLKLVRELERTQSARRAGPREEPDLPSVGVRRAPPPQPAGVRGEGPCRSPQMTTTGLTPPLPARPCLSASVPPNDNHGSDPMGRPENAKTNSAPPGGGASSE